MCRWYYISSRILAGCSELSISVSIGLKNFLRICYLIEKKNYTYARLTNRYLYYLVLYKTDKKKLMFHWNGK